MDTRATIGRLAPVLTLTAGFILAARQFLLERGVWLDEASLGLNIADRDAWGLLKPLDHGQAAPVLYLETLEAFSKIFGLSLQSLRLPSLIAYGASAWLFLSVLRKTVGNSPATVLGCALFAFNYMLVNYSGEMKQYMGDVLVTLLLLHLTLRNIGCRSNGPMELAVAGSLSLFYSNAAVIVLTACFAMLATWRRPSGDRRRMRTLTMLAISWGLSTLAYYLLFVKGHPIRGFMTAYWTRAGGFPPSDLWDPGFVAFLKKKMGLLRNAKNIFHIARTGWNETLIAIPIALFIFGRNRKNIHLLWVLLPIPLHFLLSWARLYPFEIRMTLYLLPLTMLAMTMGIDGLLRRFGLSGTLSTLMVLALCLWQGFRFHERELPIRGHEVKQAVAYAMGRAEPGAKAWVYPGIVNHLLFYRKTGDLPGWEEAVSGTSLPYDVEACTEEVLAMESDVWLLFGHIGRDEDVRIRAGLKRRGYSVADSLLTYKASAFLMRRPAE